MPSSSFQEQFYDYIRNEVAPTTSKKSFLILKLAINWDWQPLVGFIDPVEHQLVGTMPALVGENEDPFYVSSGTDIYGAYKTALNSVKVDTSGKQDEVEQIDAQINDILSKQQKTYEDYLAAWKAANLPESEKEEWKKRTGWDLRLNMFADELTPLETEKKKILASFNLGYNSATAAITNQRGFINMLKGKDTEKVPNYIVDRNGIEWRDKVAGGNSSTKIILSAASNAFGLKFLDTKFFTYSDDKSIPSMGGFPSSTIFPMISVPSNDMHILKKSVDLESDIRTQIKISFGAFTQVNVKPDPDWYHSAYLNKVGQTGSWLNDETTKQVFGPSGFHSVVTGFVAVYRPSFDISTSSQLYDQIKEITSGGGQFSLGPFSFGTLQSPSEKDFSTTDKDGGIIINSEANYAQILGVIVQNPYAEYNSI